MTRIALFGGLSVMLALFVGLYALDRAAAAGAPTEAVQSTIAKAIDILENPEMSKPGRKAERRRLLESTIGARFDYEEMTKRSLGAQWRKLSQADQKEFVDLFTTLLVKSYVGKIEGYSGEQIKYLNERTKGNYAEVRTKVISGKAEIPLDYRMISKSGDWRVYDVVVDGVSLVRNYRGQFTNILDSSSYEELVKKLRDKVEKDDQGSAP